ncbi:hypothetical protein [Actinomyces ruminis]|uniref:DUF1983 domain-containing protein n=1 Tax=Actinomyces ruminis TaxID=1937003 RepID=A0ABX4MBH4_9ACTO|nr:hypothetical protein [Actinomyces ruminis]PHP52601.1 hypothetical protein BW737_008960 [Actinomyces ruminis]
MSEYIEWPGPSTFPGAHTFPGWDDRADGADVVHSHDGRVWQETTNEYQQQVAALAAGAVEAAITRMRTVFGRVHYIKGGPDTMPSFDGETTGDTVRVQDASTLDIVAEWRWTGADWERMQVSSEQISNLDVGKLTAGAAEITEAVARRLAAVTGEFLTINTSQLTVSEQASINQAVLQEIWTRIITADDGVFARIRAGMLAANSVTADAIAGGAIDGMVITGAVIRTAATGARIELTEDGLRAYNSAGDITTQIRGQAAEIIGGTITGATIRTSAGADRTEMTQANGLRVIQNSRVVAQLASSVTNGLAVYNSAAGKLVSVANSIFGAQYKEQEFSSTTNPTSSGAYTWTVSFNAVPSGRGIFVVTGDMLMGARSPAWAGLNLYKTDDTRIGGNSLIYNAAGWGGASFAITAIGSGLATSGTFTVKAQLRAATPGRANAFTAWSPQKMSILFIPA